MENELMIGYIIKEKRKQLNLTQKALAELLGVSDKAVSKWECCEGLPDISLIPKIASTLGISIDYLLTGMEFSEKNLPEDAHSKSKISALQLPTRYYVAVLLFVAILLFFLIPNKITYYISYVYHPLLCTFLIAAVYILFAKSIKTFKRKNLSESLNSFTVADKTLILSALSCASVIILFHFIYSSALSEIPQKLAVKISAESPNPLFYNHFNSNIFTAFLILLVVLMITNMFLGENTKKIFDFSIPITSAFAFFSFTHTVFFIVWQALIIKENTPLYLFFLNLPNVSKFINKLNIICLTYLLISVIISAAFMFFIKSKTHRKIFSILVIPFAALQGGLCFSFLDKSYVSTDKYLAGVNILSVFICWSLTILIPHIVMIIYHLMQKKHMTDNLSPN